jgi:serpin B
MRVIHVVALLAMTLPASPDRDALVRGNTAFALDLYRRQPAGNVFFSPYSISTAMAMVDVGARGATESEIERAMHLPFGGARLAQGWRALLDDVNRHGAGYELVTANALWPARDIELRGDYAAAAGRDFGATLERLDFANATEASRKRINQWVAETTRGKIHDLLAPGSIVHDTRMVLTNAIYMKAAWLAELDPNSTDKHAKFLAPDAEVTVAMMHRTQPYRYFHGGGVRVIELPYAGNELSMLIVLPDARDGLAAAEQTLTPSALAEWDRQLETRRVALALPRWSSEISLELGPVLEAMGIRLAFDTRGAADFSGISEAEQVAISRVIHKARIDVTEKGTEAAAATAVLMRAGSAAVQEPPPEIFRADHPFFYVIRRNPSKSILFAGRLVTP